MGDQRTRRAFLTGGLMGVAAAAVSRVTPASAASDPVLLGASNEATRSTDIVTTYGTTNASVSLGSRNRSVGAWNTAPASRAIEATVEGEDSTGLNVFTNGLASQHGIVVFGEARATGIRVQVDRGTALVLNTGDAGASLYAEGKTIFERSGRLTFARGTAKLTVSRYRLDSGAIVLATIQGNVPGTYVLGVSVDTPNDRFTVRLNRAAPKDLVVGWFIVN